jgi:hypothetical protein
MNSDSCNYAHSPTDLVDCNKDECVGENMCGQIHKKFESIESYIERMKEISRVQSQSRTSTPARNSTPPIRSPSPFPPMTFDYMPSAIKQDSYMSELARVTSSSTADLEEYMINISKLHFLGMSKLIIVRNLHSVYPTNFPNMDSACLWINNLVQSVKKEPVKINILETLGLPPYLFLKIKQYLDLCMTS